jgi:uncharacterized membrane protein (UPF0127 family)
MSLIITAMLMGTMLFSPQPTTTPEAHPFKEYQQVQAEIGNKTYKLWVANDFRKRYRGLSNLDKMEKDNGMLFFLPEAAIHEFCMVEMKFPLDFIWLRGNKVVGLIENASPLAKNRTKLKPTEVLRINKHSDRVIELNAGEIRKNKIKIGDPVNFNPQASSLSS